METSEPLINTNDLVISNTRVFDAPKNLVFKAWADAEILKKWWGPNGFTNTFNSHDFKPEGHWHLTMHGPDGSNYPNHNVYREIVENEKIVIEHISDPKFVLTATFEDEGDKTKLIFNMQFFEARKFEQVLKIVPEANEQNFNRLDVQIAKLLINPKPLIVREFAAPKELVFKAFTEAEHLAKWWGPTGFELNIKELGVRPNGFFHYKMISDQGMEMWGKFEYFEINPFDEVVFTSAFSDENGNITPAPFFDTWPLKVLNIWTFTENEGKTTLTLKGAPFKASEGEIQAYKDNIPSMEKGFGGTFDKLEDYLESIQS